MLALPSLSLSPHLPGICAAHCAPVENPNGPTHTRDSPERGQDGVWRQVLFYVLLRLCSLRLCYLCYFTCVFFSGEVCVPRSDCRRGDGQWGPASHPLCSSLTQGPGCSVSEPFISTVHFFLVGYMFPLGFAPENQYSIVLPNPRAVRWVLIRQRLLRCPRPSAPPRKHKSHPKFAFMHRPSCARLTVTMYFVFCWFLVALVPVKPPFLWRLIPYSCPWNLRC